MIRRTLLVAAAITTTGVAFLAIPARAQQSTDIEAVKAANQVFYTTLSARDSKAMEGLWVNKPYVINIGPRSKTIAVGYADAVTKWSASLPEVFSELKATMTSTAQVQTDGKVAWVIGTESASGKNKAGEPFAFDTFVTNIFEKDGTRWLMVSHHAQIVAK
jgi:ketosteroid isomerase-like protein